MGQLRQRGKTWWIRYYREGRRYEESARTTRKDEAVRQLRLREGDIAKGARVTSEIGRLRFADAAADMLTDYRTNKKRSTDDVERRIRLHLAPWFGNRRMTTISTTDVRAYIAKRQADTVKTRADGPGRSVSNAQINRELTILKRVFSLAIQAGKLLQRPHIPMLQESAARAGFFELEQFEEVRSRLSEELQAVLDFAYVTGWRLQSEILPLEWRNVDLAGGEVRLDAGTTKNGDGRVFPLTDDLRTLLTERLRVKKEAERSCGKIIPWVFFRMVARGRGGDKAPKPIKAFTKAWKTACAATGCPGKIPHDLRRTAIRNMVRRGVPERVSMRLSGHKTRSVFDRYDIVSGGDLSNASALLNGLTGRAESDQGLSLKLSPSRRK